GKGSTRRGDHRHRTANKVRCQGRQLIRSILSPTVLDHYVLTLNIAGFLQTLAKRGEIICSGVARGPAAAEPDHRHRGLLRARRARRHTAAAPPSAAKNFRRPMWLAM